jgi:hypothetical protein
MNSTINDGEEIEKQMWEDIKAKNWQTVESKIADAFQPVHPMERATAPTNYL